MPNFPPDQIAEILSASFPNIHFQSPHNPSWLFFQTSSLAGALRIANAKTSKRLNAIKSLLEPIAASQPIETLSEFFFNRIPNAQLNKTPIFIIDLSKFFLVSSTQIKKLPTEKLFYSADSIRFHFSNFRENISIFPDILREKIFNANFFPISQKNEALSFSTFLATPSPNSDVSFKFFPSHRYCKPLDVYIFSIDEVFNAIAQIEKNQSINGKAYIFRAIQTAAEYQSLLQTNAIIINPAHALHNIDDQFFHLSAVTDDFPLFLQILQTIRPDFSAIDNLLS